MAWRRLLLWSLFLPLVVVVVGTTTEEREIRRVKKYFDEKSHESGIIRLGNGVLVEIIKTGVSFTAKSPRRQDRCKVSFTIKNREGDILETSKMVLQPREIPHQSWGNIYTMMTEGDMWRVYVPPELAYGAEGQPERNIAPHTPLIVDMEVHLVMGAGKSREEAQKLFLEAQKPLSVDEL